MKTTIFAIIFLVLSFSAYASSPYDSTRNAYRSFGFNASSVSGLGLSFREHYPTAGLVQLTGGIIKTTEDLAFTLGFEYQYDISKRTDFRYYVCLGSGMYNSSNSNFFAFGFGIGFDIPILGKEIKENMTFGLSLFYPTLFTGDEESTIAFGGSANFFYNF